MKKQETLVEDIVQMFLGLAFIVSGLSKAFAANYFGRILSSYGCEMFFWLSPVIILGELLLGLCMFWNIYPKLSTAIMATVLICFTGIYMYGHLALGLRDCGCYGKIKFLNLSGNALYIRNLLFICGALWLFSHSKSVAKPISKTIISVSSSILIVAAFISGYTLPGRKSNNIPIIAKDFRPVALENHPLNGYIGTSVDSTYLVTVFSYSCPHCINSMGNIEQFEKFNIVDKVIGLGAYNEDNADDFRKVLTPSFYVTNYTYEQISNLTLEFPTTYFIRNDSIVNTIQGEVPSAYFYMKEVSKD